MFYCPDDGETEGIFICIVVGELQGTAVYTRCFRIELHTEGGRTARGKVCAVEAAGNAEACGDGDRFC